VIPPSRGDGALGVSAAAPAEPLRIGRSGSANRGRASAVVPPDQKAAFPLTHTASEPLGLTSTPPPCCSPALCASTKLPSLGVDPGSHRAVQRSPLLGTPLSCFAFLPPHHFPLVVAPPSLFAEEASPSPPPPPPSPPPLSRDGSGGGPPQGPAGHRHPHVVPHSPPLSPTSSLTVLLLSCYSP